MWQVILPSLFSLVDKLIPDQQAAANAKLKVMEMQQSGQLKEFEGAVQILTTEMQGNWLQKSWRPVVMLTVAALIVARWLGSSAPNLSQEEYLALWSIVELGLGGYVIGRSAEKIAGTVAENLKKGK
jgi:hypothetical protein